LKVKDESKKNIQRYYPDEKTGLSSFEVEKRKKEKLTNVQKKVLSKSCTYIVLDNLCTLFNLINLVLFAAVLYSGSYKNMMFMGVVVLNFFIGTFQEIRAKRAVDKLLFIYSSKSSVIRDKKEIKINTDEIVLDDVIVLCLGDQVPVDCTVISGEASVNEAFVTGESEPLFKKKGDTILSGSIIDSGRIWVRAEKVGSETYAARLSKMAKYFKKPNSEIMTTLKKIIKIVSIIIIPVSAVVFYNQYNNLQNTLDEALVQTVAAVLGMIPEGLMLLTSTVLAVSVIRLSKRKILVQELYCIETLARVDVICLDKTGTLTSGEMTVVESISLSDEYDAQDCAINIIKATSDKNQTALAFLKKYKQKNEERVIKAYPFSSKYKYSGAVFEGLGFFALGAPDFVIKNRESEIFERVMTLSKKYRVLILAKSDAMPDENGVLPEDMTPVSLFCLSDEIRSGAEKTLEYFKDQGVDIKVISGDHPLSVSAIAEKTGLRGYDRFVDASTLSDEELKAAASEYTVFGRVTPEQKKVIVRALKENGHTVAMTGDGVNDTLALKEADCSIAMASGSDAARSISQLVLLDSNFDCVPDIVYEGRRSINNLERSSTLYLSKTFYTTLLALFFLFFNAPYPFIPIQLTLIGTLSIGIPSFFLALEPNKNRVRKNFLLRILVKTVPGAVTMFLSVISLIVAKQIFGISQESYSTLCVICVGFSAFLLLFRVSLPMSFFRTSLFAVMAGAFAVCIVFLKALLVVPAYA